MQNGRSRRLTINKAKRTCIPYLYRLKNYRMPPLNDIFNCETCSKTNGSHQCTHCLSRYCYQCLIKHHHNDIKQEFTDLIKRIDQILDRFLHHAHNQTEWTDHLTNDRRHLEIFIRYIDTSFKQYPISSLPTFQWIYHVQRLISKTFYAIDESCCKFMYPFRDSFTAS